jgi:hypothetical protein
VTFYEDDVLPLRREKRQKKGVCDREKEDQFRESGTKYICEKKKLRYQEERKHVFFKE